MRNRIERKRKSASYRLAGAWQGLLAGLAGLVLVCAAATGRAQWTTGEPASGPDTATSATASAEPSSVGDNPIPTQNLWSIIRSGGVLMIPLGMCSFLLLTFTFERAISLRRARIIPKPFVRRFLEQMRQGELDREAALALCEGNGSPVSQAFAGAVRKWGRPAVEVEQGIIDAGERVTNTLRRYLRVLNAIATISPLLGLLGTVFGIIRAFNAIATSHAMGRPELLAAGISEALVTTAAGLSIAIPAMAAYLFFASRVDRLIMDIDGLGQELVPLISAEEMGTRTRPAAAAKPTGPVGKSRRKPDQAAA